MKLWEPSTERKEQATITHFMRAVQASVGEDFADAHALYHWSIQHPQQFWSELCRFSKVSFSKPYSSVLENSDRMPGARWFPGARLNFAEHLLRFRDEQVALLFWGEDEVRRSITYAGLYRQVSRLARRFREIGIRPGDRIAGVVANMPEAIIAMLAATSLGAVWSSCSPDFGVSGILDRFSQIEPSILVAVDGYFHKGAEIDITPKLIELIPLLPSVRRAIIIQYLGCADIAAIPQGEFFEVALGSTESGELVFEQLPFAHPLYIMFSSGTTGKPKCIIHSAGGTLIEHLKELQLHCDVTRADRIFYQTTCGWMMWNLLISSLAIGATVVLYDGAAFHRAGEILFDLIEEERLTIFGTNAKFLAEAEKNGTKPRLSHDLSSLKTILSTGSPLLPEGFEYVYRDIKQDVLLSSISGGTDILGCFVLGCPTLPVLRSELQLRSLALQVEVFDDKGSSIVGAKGELVCRAPFPSMPVGFWNDPDGSRYRKAYFERFPGSWHHGDYVELSKQEGMIFFGRSDAVLNPGGVRIGTSEIYRIVEKFPEVAESIVVGQDWNNDVRVVLFVKLAAGAVLDEALRERLKREIRAQASPYHVPRKIISVPDIPRTRSNKIVEIAVRDVIHGREVLNKEALLNPEALQSFANCAELSTE